MSPAELCNSWQCPPPWLEFPILSQINHIFQKKSHLFSRDFYFKHKWQNNKFGCGCLDDKNGNSKTLIKSIRRQQMWHRLVILRVTNTNSTTNLNFPAIIIGIHGSITVTTDTCFLHIWPKMTMGVQTLGWRQTTTMLSTYSHFHAVMFSLLVVNRASCGAHWTKKLSKSHNFCSNFYIH